MKFIGILSSPGSEFHIREPATENTLSSVLINFTLEVDTSLVPVECSCHKALKSHRGEVIPHVTWVHSIEGSEEED